MEKKLVKIENFTVATVSDFEKEYLVLINSDYNNVAGFAKVRPDGMAEVNLTKDAMDLLTANYNIRFGFDYVKDGSIRKPTNLSIIFRLNNKEMK